MNKNKQAFTLIEIMVMVAILTMISGVAYRLMTGTFSQFFKSQTKLTNLRAASLILERLKADMRLALIPITDAEKPVVEGSKIEFCIIDEGRRRMVKYSFNDGEIRRNVVGGSNRIISKVKVSDFRVEESGEGDSKLISIVVVVDSDKDLEDRSQSNKGNQVELRAVLYPRFFIETLSDEEKFWNLARYTSGGTP